MEIPLIEQVRTQARMLVPVVGPDVTMVKVGDAEQTFNSVIGQRLAERFGLTVPRADDHG